MTGLFLKIINMSISASWVVLAVLLIRLVLKKAPKWVNVLLWGIVAVRLICPFSIKSAVSLIPSTQTIPDEVLSGPSFDIQTGIEPVDDRVNDYLGDRYFEGVTVPVGNGLNVMTALSVVWLAGVAALLIYTSISYLRLRRKVNTAVLYKDNIFQSESVNSPFVLGVIKPRIYIPYNISGQALEYMSAHETAHIRRGDHRWKLLGFLLLTIYWFNPLMWLAYVLLCRDIELACDEKVIKGLESDQRADYTQTLVAYSVNRRVVTACPLAFGETGVKERVKSIMNYKKPAFWMIILAASACVIVAVCFLTDPFGLRLNFDGNKIVSAECFDMRNGNEESLLRELSQAQIDELMSRLRDVDNEKRKDLYGGLTPFYQISAMRQDESRIIISGYSSDKDMVDILFDGRRYAVTDKDFCQYLSRVCAGGDTAKADDVADLQAAKESGFIVMEDGECTWGAEKMEEFYQTALSGKPASVKLMHYWTLDRENCDETYYEENKDNYPKIFELHLVYDGEKFTINWSEMGEDYTQEYRYLMKYSDETAPYLSTDTPREKERYVLTNDNTVTWDELMRGILSSQFGDYIEHFNVCTNVK